MEQHGDGGLGGVRDNIQLPYAGLRFAEMSTAQQRLLLRRDRDVHRADPARPRRGQLDEVRRHLGDTYFAWIGACDDDSPFYYRVQSPVVLIEFDHQRGIHLDERRADRAHIHTVVRTPNGNDYGKDLLRQHYAESSHHARH